MLQSAPERPGGGAPRRRRARVGLVAALLVAAAGVPWAAPQVATSLAEVADAIVPGPAQESLVPAAVQIPAVPVPEESPGPITGDESDDGLGGVPRLLVIPSLGVRAAVAPVSGRTGELTPPDDPRLAGWWQEGARAGAPNGSVVVVGHTVRSGGGVFDHLAGLRPGDDASLRTATGWVRYDVTESRTLSVEELARRAGALFTRTGPGRLVLVTCTGFDGEIYRARTVVVATPVSRAAGSPG